MSTNLQDYVELLNAEQHVQVDKLRDHARHGVAPRVRGEVWMYLLGVLSEDKTNEITTVMALSSSYALLPSSLPSNLSALLLKTALRHHTHRFFNPTYAGLISSITAEPVLEQQAPDRGRDVAGKQLSSPPTSTAGAAATARSATTIGADSSGSSRPAPSTSTSSTPKSVPSGPAPLTTTMSASNSPPSTSSSAPTSSFLSKPDLTSATITAIADSPSSSVPAPTSTFSSSSAPVSASPAPADETQSLRTQYGRFLPPPPTSPHSRHSYLTILEEVLGKFYHSEREEGRDGEYRRRLVGMDTGCEEEWVWLVTPFLCCLTRPVAVYLGFQKLSERMRSFPSISSRLAMFLTLFRMALPDLFLYFEDEQVRYQDIGLSWVRTLFAKEMWLGNVMRLWDAYLAADDMFELHCYVCVAVLATCRETLEELDGSEVKMMLLDLPPLDIDRLLQDAANLRVTYSIPRPVDE